MSGLIILIIMVVSALISYYFYSKKNAGKMFYAFVVAAVLIVFFAQRSMGPMDPSNPVFTHYIIAASLVVGHMIGVFARTWKNW
ncbi:MAG: hypothetical protein K8S56_06895 [Candidatus Cloacimonetes bacterium]|nr:hypothetical protein [Candidatus Cloacimonadota bacterium]